MNNEIQTYRGLKLQLKDRDDYRYKKAKEYNVISHKGYFTDNTIWIPNSFQIYNDGTLDTSKNFMFIFNKKDIIDKLYNCGYKILYK